MTTIDPSLFAAHDDETLAGMHGLEVAEVAAQRVALTGTAEAVQEAATAPVGAPPAEPAAEPAEKPRRGQKPKPAPEAPAPAAEPTGRQVFRVEVPFDHTTSLDVFRTRLMAAVDAEIAKLPDHLQDRRGRPAISGRTPGSAVKFIGPRSLRVNFPGSRSATEVNYGDIIVGGDADHMAEHHAEHVEPHPRLKR